MKILRNKIYFDDQNDYHQLDRNLDFMIASYFVVKIFEQPVPFIFTYLQNWSPLRPKCEVSASFIPVWHHSHLLFFLNMARRCRPKHRSLQNLLRTLRPPRISESEIKAQGPGLWHQEQQPEDERSITVSSSGSSTSMSLLGASGSESSCLVVGGSGSFLTFISSEIWNT